MTRNRGQAPGQVAATAAAATAATAAASADAPAATAATAAAGADTPAATAATAAAGADTPAATAAGPAAASTVAADPASVRIPALYLGHGAPPLLEDEEWTTELRTWAAGLPRPRRILIVSAHWQSAPIAISSTHRVPLVYDFAGFPEHYYRMTYDAPGAPGLAADVRALMPAGEQVLERETRGLDHGAWVPLTAMFPDADIPVLQMSLPDLDPAHLFEVGRRLAPLRDDGTLIVGSGFLTHGLPFIHDYMGHVGVAPAWSVEFDRWASEALARGDLDSLFAFREKAPGMPYAHPTVEHLAPLFVTLGAAARPDAPPETAIEGFWWGLSKRAFQTG